MIIPLLTLFWSKIWKIIFKEVVIRFAEERREGRTCKKKQLSSKREEQEFNLFPCVELIERIKKDNEKLRIILLSTSILIRKNMPGLQ